MPVREFVFVELCGLPGEFMFELDGLRQNYMPIDANRTV